MSQEKITSFVKINIIPILILIYFVRFAIPQGIYSLTFTGLFYTLTIYLVVGCLIVAGLIGTVGYIKSRLKDNVFTAQHKSFLITAILGLALFGVSFITRHAYFNQKFDSELWKDKSVSMEFDSNLLTLRQKMMEDLTENILPGLKKSEVESVLGFPNYSSQPEEGGWDFTYIIGPEKGLGVDFQCLRIHFDDKDYFESYEDIPVCG